MLSVHRWPATGLWSRGKKPLFRARPFGMLCGCQPACPLRAAGRWEDTAPGTVQPGEEGAPGCQHRCLTKQACPHRQRWGFTGGVTGEGTGWRGTRGLLGCGTRAGRSVALRLSVAEGFGRISVVPLRLRCSPLPQTDTDVCSGDRRRAGFRSGGRGGRRGAGEVRKTRGSVGSGRSGTRGAGTCPLGRAESPRLQWASLCGTAVTVTAAPQSSH